MTCPNPNKQRIPVLLEVQKIRLKFYFDCGKKSMFYNLVQTNFHRRYKCILISVSGFLQLILILIYMESSYYYFTHLVP
jgi:hypothetical protein